MKTLREHAPILLAALIVGIVIVAPDSAGWLFLALLIGGIAYGVWRYRTDMRAARKWADSWPDLSHLDDANMRAESDVWLITAPYGYGAWSLYAPGTARDERRYLVGAPVALLPVSQDASDDDSGMERLPEWAGPWIEQVTGGQVRFVLVGWSLPYGQWEGRELCAYAYVTRADDRQTTEAVVD